MRTKIAKLAFFADRSEKSGFVGTNVHLTVGANFDAFLELVQTLAPAKLAHLKAETHAILAETRDGDCVMACCAVRSDYVLILAEALFVAKIHGLPVEGALIQTDVCHALRASPDKTIFALNSRVFHFLVRARGKFIRFRIDFHLLTKRFTLNTSPFHANPIGLFFQQIVQTFLFAQENLFVFLLHDEFTQFCFVTLVASRFVCRGIFFGDIFFATHDVFVRFVGREGIHACLSAEETRFSVVTFLQTVRTSFGLFALEARRKLVEHVKDVFGGLGIVCQVNCGFGLVFFGFGFFFLSGGFVVFVGLFAGYSSAFFVGLGDFSLAVREEGDVFVFAIADFFNGIWNGGKNVD